VCAWVLSGFVLGGLKSIERRDEGRYKLGGGERTDGGGMAAKS
jgi:hypothetical protein